MSIAGLDRPQARPAAAPRQQGAVDRDDDRTGFRSLTRWALALVALGAAWRTVRYLLHFPIWGDEAFICLNFLDRDYLGLLRPLRFGQVAPVLFLWSEATAFHLLGGTELALRLLPLLAGLAGLALFWRLARLFFPWRGSDGGLAATVAVGILAVAYYPVRHSCEIKPYSFDLLMALALLVPAVSWVRRPGRWWWLVVLVVVVPVTLAASYPAVFVAGSVSIALLVPAWRSGWKTWGLYAAYNLAMVITFLGLYRVVGTAQFKSTGGTGNAYWSDWFPPGDPLALGRWLLAAHTGTMMAYPVGSYGGGSTITFLLCLAGAVRLARSRQRELLLLCIVPFGLTFAAACLHRYPYGGSARIAQHLAPAICLLAGAGVAELVGKFSGSPASRLRWGLAACAVLALVGTVGMARDLTKPYKTDGDRQVRQLLSEIIATAGPGDPIVVVDPPADMGPTFEWYLRTAGSRITWAYGRPVDWDHAEATAGQIWCLRFAPFLTAPDDLAARLARSQRPWVLESHVAHTMQMGFTDDTIERCEVFHWVLRQ